MAPETAPALRSDVPEPLPGASGGAYRWYVLGLLMLIYAFNFIDRQVITILAPELKRDLGLTDAQLGLLYGTAFAMFYSLFGIPLAKLADGWSRVKTLAIGLTFWSAMTTLSGFASSFAQLGAARLGVGIGEASGSPAAVSLLSDYFPKAMRATALAIYTTGLYVGMGLSLVIGGYVLATWDGAFGLRGWQAAFIVVGLPGVVLAAIVLLTVREPVRGGLDGVPAPGIERPFLAVLSEAATMFPPFSLFMLRRLGASGKLVAANGGVLLIGVLFAVIMTIVFDSLIPAKRNPVLLQAGGIAITTSFIQWMSIGIGFYAAISWVQAIRLRDPVAHALTVGNGAFLATAAAGGLLGVFTYSIGAFVFVYGTEFLGLDPRAGLWLGVIAAVSGLAGSSLGGFLADIAKRRHPAGRLYILMAAVVGFAALTVFEFTTTSTTLFYICHALALLLLSAWPPILLATGQDLVIPRLRGTGFAIQALCTSLIGLGLGPYLVGAISDATGDLRTAILSLLLLVPPLMFVLIRCAALLPGAERTVMERAMRLSAPAAIQRTRKNLLGESPV